MIEQEDAERLARESLAKGETEESVLALWREHGLSILHSIRCLAHVKGVSIGEAKEIVHCSQTWSDLRAEHDLLQNNLEKLAEYD